MPPKVLTRTLQEQTLAYRWKVGHMFANSEVSKNMLSHFFDSLTALKLDSHFLCVQACPKCYSVFFSSDHITRFNPKKRITKRYAKALKKMAETGEIQRKYKKKAKKLLQSSTTLKTKCLLCGYLKKIKGANYAEVLERRGGNTGKSKQKTKGKNVSKERNNPPGSNLYVLAQKKSRAPESVRTQLQSFLKSL